MIKIGICDDDKIDLEKTDSLVKEWAKQNMNMDIIVYSFSSAYTLLDQVERDGDFSLFLLDILMPEMTGISLAEHLHALCDDALIIYLTSSEDFYPEAFRVYAFQYVLKPVGKSVLFDVLDKAKPRCMKRAQDIFPVKTKEGVIQLGFHTIAYAELFNHICYLHLSNLTVIKSHYLRTRFDEFAAPLLKDPRFWKTHASFIVNLDYAGRLTPHSIFLTTGDEIPIARSYTKSFQQQYMDYALHKFL